jgi:hypothetical protein
MTKLKTKKSIVIYFSRADENYGVWYIEKWNTEVIAEYIQELIWADLFKVERKKSLCLLCVEKHSYIYTRLLLFKFLILYFLNGKMYKGLY